MKTKIILLFVLILLIPETALAYSEWPFSAMLSGAIHETGKGVRIALVDTGISAENLDSDLIEPGKNYVFPGKTTQDLIGHGTAVAGIILGSEVLGLEGLAENAALIPLVCYTLDDKGEPVIAEADVIVQAIRDAIDDFDADIITVSTGLTKNNCGFKDAVAYAEANGVVIVSGVGNDGRTNPKTLWYPAAYETVIGAAAIGKTGRISDFSQKNFTAALSAPGEKIKVVPVERKGYITNEDGTSFSAAFISAGVALLIEKYPQSNPETIREMLYESALDIEEVGFDDASGWGVMQIDKALATELEKIEDDSTQEKKSEPPTDEAEQINMTKENEKTRIPIGGMIAIAVACLAAVVGLGWALIKAVDSQMKKRINKR